MDQDTVVSEQTENAPRLIRALEADNFAVSIAFWAKPTDEGRWFLYLVCPAVDKEGPAAAYRSVQRVLRRLPDLWIDLLNIRVIGSNDSLAEALELTRPRVPLTPFAVRNSKPYPGMTRLGSTTLGGISFDGALIYPATNLGSSA